MLEPSNLSPSFLIGGGYDGEKQSVFLTLYEPKSAKIYIWYDPSFEPYCLTNLSPIELEAIGITKHEKFKRYEIMMKYNPLRFRDEYYTKIVAKDPLAIGGRSKKCMRKFIPEKWNGEKPAHVWEANIRFYQCYLYDKGINLGMLYRIENGKLMKVVDKQSEENIKKILETLVSSKTTERWARLLEYPVPEFVRLALDIEVLSPSPHHVPDPARAEHPVICVSLIGSDGRKAALVLLRDGAEIGEETLPEGVSIRFFDNERKLLMELFTIMEKYPFIVTFNGDNFDLNYLWHRALNLGMVREEIPIVFLKNMIGLRHGVHIDLYRFFSNRSLRIYAFQAKYDRSTLDEIGRGLIKLGKLYGIGDFNVETYSKIAKYCYRDAEITMGLTTYDDDLVMKLILVLTRISNMSIDDVTRSPISRWIRSFLYEEHRRRNFLIPNKDDLKVRGGASTKAVIKGKKYKGAIVVEPVDGIHFNVKVMDFASLYPSVMKVYNIGYQSLRCPHESCKKNKVPQTANWICTKVRAIESELIGTFRDLRVKWYKPKRKGNPWYGIIEQSIKVILNASYGVFGSEDFPLYTTPVPESITAYGRESILKSIDKARQVGVKVLYGDTDSIFLKAPTDEQVKEISDWAVKKIGIQLDIDKVYRYAVLSSRKKNYVGIKPDGNVDIKGLTGKKKHIPPMIKGAFDITMKHLGKAKTMKEVEATKKILKKIVRTYYLKLKNRDWDDLSELAFSITLGKDPAMYEKTLPQHVRVALVYEDKTGIALRKGDIVRYVKTKGKKVNALPLELATDKDVDTDKYIKQLWNTFEQVLDSFNISWNDIIGVRKLEDYFT